MSQCGLTMMKTQRIIRKKSPHADVNRRPSHREESRRLRKLFPELKSERVITDSDFRES